MENSETINLYRIKHKPTGFYYTPSKGSGNLSKKGKVYVGRKPSLDYVKVITIKLRLYSDRAKKLNKSIIDYFNINIDQERYFYSKLFETNLEDWEIVKYPETHGSH